MKSRRRGGGVLEYAQHQMTAANQVLACNRLHRAEARFSRWLLMVSDRIGSGDLPMTQEFMSIMLGTRRTTVAEGGGRSGARRGCGGTAGRVCGSRIGRRWSRGLASATPFSGSAISPFTANLPPARDGAGEASGGRVSRGLTPRAVLGLYTTYRGGASFSRDGSFAANEEAPAFPFCEGLHRMSDPQTSSPVLEQVTGNDLDQLSINTLRILAVDQVEKAKNGHPGAPLGCAPIAYLLFHKFMKYNPHDPLWSDRDRFVLSNGHASALQYGVLHLAGYDLPLEQLKNFREWGSHTPGHPEYGETPGVEVTTGPLGQGLAEAVGLAIAEKHMGGIYNTNESKIVDHYTYVLCGDGDLMEGISHESCSLAGTLQLGKLILLYDDNLISLDGPTGLSFTEDVSKRFEAYDWHVQFVSDGNDLVELNRAIEAAKMERTKPSIIRVRTVIGYGSPKAGTKSVHGEALGAEASKATKKFFGFPEDKSFYIPDEALANWRKAVDKGKVAQQQWQDRFESYKKENPELAAQYTRCTEMKLPDGWQKALPTFPTDKPMPTRKAGQAALNALGAVLPELFGGAAESDQLDLYDFQGFGKFPSGSEGPQRVLRRAGVWHDGGGERHRRAWGSAAFRLDLLYLFGLLPIGDSHGGAAELALALHLYA